MKNNNFSLENASFESISTVIANIITVITGIIAIITFFRGDSQGGNGTIIVAFVLVVFLIVIQFYRLRKYEKQKHNRMKVITSNMHKLLHNVRNTYFEVMHEHKKETLTERILARYIKGELVKILDNYCKVMSEYTGQKVSACVKLIEYNDSQDTINRDNATLVTFCRSENSDDGRAGYEVRSPKIKLKENTDFDMVVDENNQKIAFYQGDLCKFEKQRESEGLRYDNSNPHWKDYYRATVVVPIRIEHDKLYHLKRDDAYHILGFLCVDSMSTKAFLPIYEKYITDLAYAYADIIYILLGQYRHYLRKFHGIAKKEAS